VKRRVIWSRDALHTLKDAARPIARDNPQAAHKVAGAIRATGNALGERAIGRRGRVTGTYERPVTGSPDIPAYAIGPAAEGDEAVFILHVSHMAREGPAESWPKKECERPSAARAAAPQLRPMPHGE
jgi:plasmid stabilization system protein ParE